MLKGTQAKMVLFDEPIRMVYVFRPNEDMTIEPEYFMHDKKPPIGTIWYDPHEGGNPWNKWTPYGHGTLLINQVPKHLRAAALILGNTS